MADKINVATDEYASPGSGHEKPETHIHGIVEAAHLYQGQFGPHGLSWWRRLTGVTEDAQGRVISRLLLPRPTEDPKDPLIWPTWRKHLANVTLCFFVFLSNYITSSIAPILVLIAQDFGVSITKSSYLFTINLLFLGLGNLFWIPLSLKIGKRPVLVLCAAIFFVSSIWSAVAKSWGSMLGARIVQGFSASVVEGLGPTVVGDLFFVHERGLWMGLYIWVFSTGSSMSGVFAGFIANATPDWRWVMWMNAILTGVCLVLVILFSAETNFKRPEDTEGGEGLDSAQLDALRARSNTTWLQSLSMVGWYDREVSVWWLWWRPFLTLQYPAVVWGSLTYGSCLGALAFQVSANAFTFPAQYNFSPMATGNIGLSYFACGCLGAIVGGPISDWIVAFVTKRRGGYFIPEFRLWCLVLPCILLPVGLMMWGVGIQNHLPAMVPIVASGIMWGILIAVSCTGLAYVVDCYRPLAGETMTILTALKNTITFGMSFANLPWLQLDGYVKTSGWLLFVVGIIFLTTIPMYIYGERIRRWTQKLVV